MVPNEARKSFRIKANLFYSNLAEVFQLPEFQAKLFLSESEWLDMLDVMAELKKGEICKPLNDLNTTATNTINSYSTDN